MRRAARVPGELAAAYRSCRTVARRSSSTYFLAIQLLPIDLRWHVYALYAMTRIADDIVDEPGADPAGELAAFEAEWHRALDGGAARPELRAAANTAVQCDLPVDAVDRFFRSMAMDLDVTSYETWDDLVVYMDGSGAAIGELLLPILGPVDLAAALGPARDLGLAFQLTNFLRDIGDDLDRGRVYLPQADIERFGADVSERAATPEFVALMRFEIERCRALYRSAEAGVALLPPRSARCVRAAHALYRSTLDRIEANGCDVFADRARLGRHEKLLVVARSLGRD